MDILNGSYSSGDYLAVFINDCVDTSPSESVILSYKHVTGSSIINYLAYLYTEGPFIHTCVKVDVLVYRNNTTSEFGLPSRSVKRT